MSILHPQATRYSTNGASLALRLRWRMSTVMFTCGLGVARALAVSEGYWRVLAILSGGVRFVSFWTSGGAKFPKMGDSLPRTPVNHRANFDAASFILAG